MRSVGQKCHTQRNELNIYKHIVSPTNTQPTVIDLWLHYNRHMHKVTYTQTGKHTTVQLIANDDVSNRDSID